MDPIEDQRQAISLEQRPLRKQQMALEKERMLLQPLHAELEMEAEPIREELNEYKNNSGQVLKKWEREERKKIDQQAEEIKKKAQASLLAQMEELSEEQYALDERKEGLEDAFRDEFEGKRRELEDQVDELREEKFRPMEEAAEALNAEIEDRWVALDALYQEQGDLNGQLEELEKRVRDLDRQAEFGVLEVLQGAMANVEEMEKGGGGIGSFDQFLPQMGGGEGGPGGDGGGGQAPSGD